MDNPFPPLASKERLSQARRVLYMTHLAIGDYMYQGVFLQALKEQYPRLQIDIWIDDCRKKPKPWHAGRNNTLCQWLERDATYGHIYPIAATPAQRADNIQRAQGQHYDVVFFFATQRSEQFARYARQAAPKGFIAGTQVKPLSNPLSKWWHFRGLDAYFTITPQTIAHLEHISDIYQQHFNRLVALEPIDYSPSRTLTLTIPESLQQLAAAKLETLAQTHSIHPACKIFINHLSTTEKRDYQWSQVEALLAGLKEKQPNSIFVLNVPPAELTAFQTRIATHPSLGAMPVMAFSATEDFYQLPAMIQACDRVITVETAIMHIAASLNTPQIALVRESASQWYPLNCDTVLSAGNRVDQIQVNDVIEHF